MAKKSLAVKKTVKRSEGRKNSHPLSAVSNEVMKQIRQLGWMAQHARAM
jgi:hypothetical protein